MGEEVYGLWEYLNFAHKTLSTGATPSTVHRWAFLGFHFLLGRMSQASQTNSSALIKEMNFHFLFHLHTKY